jgi:hypothetical protein
MVDSNMYLHHEHPLAGHPGARKMTEAIRKTFYITKLTTKVKAWVKHCQCARAKAKKRSKAELTLSRPIPEIYVWLVLDLVGPFTRSRSGKYYWLTLMDAFSKDLELVALGTKSAEGIAEKVLEQWICRRGCPRFILSDNARELVGDVATSLCKLLNIQKETVTTYHHPASGLVERVHTYAHSIMRSSQPQRLSQWDEFLPFIQFAIMTHEIDASGVTPFLLKHGLSPTMPADLTSKLKAWWSQSP